MGKKLLVLSMVMVLTLSLLTGCGTQKSDVSKIKVGSKNFTEAVILGEMYALALENNGYEVERKLNLGGTMVAHESLKQGEIDLYPEYTGTGLINVLGETPKSDPQEVYDIVSGQYKDNWNLIWLHSSEANDSQGMVVTRKVAEKYNLYTLSRLAQLAPQLRLAAVPEFEEREDALKGLKKFYGGFEFKDIKLYDYGIKYRVIENDEADVTVGFTTDGELTKENLVLLEDDKHFWPPYHVVPVVRGELLEKTPEIANILDIISAKLTNEVLQSLNAEVDINKREYAEVAKEFLEKEGLMTKE